MKQVGNPRCRGSKRLIETPHVKRARCPFCSNLVLVQDGKFCEHWWSKRAKRFHSGLRNVK